MTHLFWLVCAPILITIALYLLNDKGSKISYVLFQLAFLGFVFAEFYRVNTHGPIEEILGGYGKGIGISLVLDKLSASFVLLNVFLFTCFIIFNIHKSYMDKLFLFLFFTLQGLINGIFLSYDLFNIYVLVELSTVIVSILIMFKKDKQSIYDGMLYLITNIVSMTLFLLGVGYLYKIFGSLDMNLIGALMEQISDKSTLFLPYSLIITAVCLKSAVMPLFSWLPRAHGTPSAPSIVSAVLSGIYIKASLYLFLRLHDVFDPLINTDSLFVILGLSTAVIGFVVAISRDDIKLILAFSTVSQIGLIIFAISLNSDYGLYGGIYHIYNHAFIKAILFLVAGIIIETYETRNIHQIKGVFRRMPFIGIVTIIASLAITGFPYLNGSISKYYIQKGALSLPNGEILMHLINFGTILIMLRFCKMLWGSPEIRENDHAEYKIHWNQIFILTLLCGACLAGGIWGTSVIYATLGYSGSISTGAMLSKGLVYMVMIGLGLLFYQFLYGRIPLFNGRHRIEFAFNQIILSIVVFFAFLFSYLNVVG